MNHEKCQQLVSVLHECVAACQHCINACLQENNVKIMTTCIRLDMDCADVCALTAQFVSRHSVYTKHIIKDCIEICKACAEECSKHTEMDHCMECAEACKKCIEACIDYQMNA